MAEAPLLLSRFLLIAAAVIGAGPAGISTARAFEIRFDYRYDTRGFFDPPVRRELLERAAEEYTRRLRDQGLAALPEAPFVAVFPHPSEPSLVEREDVEVPRDTLLVFVGARALERRLAVGAPGQARFPCFDWLGSQACFDAMRGRGDVRPVRDWIDRHLFRGSAWARAYPATDFATWGGTLSFDSDAPWHFGRSAVPADRYDFLSSAIHELGHVLGMGTAESWGSRTRNGTFAGERVVALVGEPVPLEADGSHWARGTRAPDARERQEAAFGPELGLGTRRWLTDLDVAALEDIGWRVDDALREPTLYDTRWMKGDVNGDGAVDDLDARLVRAFLDEPEWDSPVPIAAGDVAPLRDGDGVLDEADVAVLEKLVGISAIAETNQGRVAPYRLEAQLLVKAQRLLPEDPYAAARLAGWLLTSDPLSPRPYAVRRVALTRGDVDGDGLLGAADVAALHHHVALERLAAPRAYDAADIAPMLQGDATGDGIVDAADAALFQRVVQEVDVDGDGLATSEENLLNQLVWMPVVGRPRYEPLTRWTEACLDFDALGTPRVVAGETGGPSMEFCSRDGSPWSRAASLSPDQLAEEQAAAARPAGVGAGPRGSELPESPVSAESPAPGPARGGGVLGLAPAASEPPPPTRDPTHDPVPRGARPLPLAGGEPTAREPTREGMASAGADSGVPSARRGPPQGSHRARSVIDAGPREEPPTPASAGERSWLGRLATALLEGLRWLVAACLRWLG